MTIDKQKESAVFYSLRAFAILSVAYAHSLSLRNEALSRIVALLGLIGVPVFLICSGYYYTQSKLNKDWFKGRFESIVIPWLIWGSFAYVLSLTLGRNSNGNLLFDYLYYLVGYYTWLYYVPIYLITIIIYQVIRPSKNVIIVSIIITMISNCLTYYLNPEIGITPYQNPLNWIGFYAIGVGLKGRLNGIIEKKRVLVYGVIAFGFGLVIVLARWKVCYWHPLSILFELASFVVLLYVTNIINGKPLQIIGKNSYILYFLHMQQGIAITNRFFSFLHCKSEVVEFWLKPVVVLSVTLLIVYVIAFTLKLIGLSKLTKYLGIKL